ncbi:MAG: hypothetical protein JSU87_12585 [Gemmatimonadota bacterium]|nr:MAG: hypothetical protein JSU87_12585 [Gemmatimonadota bacterium]
MREAISTQLERRWELFGPEAAESPWLFPTVAAMGGWRDPSVTRQAYQHADPSKRREAMEDRRPWDG